MSDQTLESMLAAVEAPVTASAADHYAEIASVFDLDIDTAQQMIDEPSVGTTGGDGAGGQTSAPEPAQAPAAQPTDGQAPAAQPTAAPAATETPPAAPASAAQPAEPDPVALELANLKAKIAQLEAGKTEPAAGANPDGKAAPAGEGTQQPNYAVQLPEAVMGQLFGEDPNAAAVAMNAIVSSVLTHAHTTAKTLVDELRAEIQKNVIAPQEQSSIEQQQAAQRDDYYKHFPEHNNPQYSMIIAQQAAELSAEFPHLGWDDNFRNALGARVTRALAALGVAPTQTTPTTPANPTPPAAFLPTGTRPAGGDNVPDLISETLG